MFFKAIRSEYLKLKGVMFGWVEGTYPSGDTRVVLKFESHYNLLNYTHWNTLNTLYFSQVVYRYYLLVIIYCLSPQIKRINHDSNEVLIDIPEGRYTQDQLRDIHEVAVWIC